MNVNMGSTEVKVLTDKRSNLFTLFTMIFETFARFEYFADDKLCRLTDTPCIFNSAIH